MGGWGFSLGRGKRSQIDCGDGSTCANTLKTTELYSLNGWIV